MAKIRSLDEQSLSNELTETAWLDVLRQMENAYTELINHQIELEQKNTKLEEVNQLISSVQRSMTEVLLVTNLSGKVIQINHSLEKLAEYQFNPNDNLDIADFFTSQDSETVELIHQHKEFSQKEVYFKFNKHGFPIILNGTRLLDGNQQIQGMVLVGREISELRLAYKQLEESHRELKLTQEQLINAEKMASLGRLVAGVAHELNNPISFIYGNTHALMNYAERLLPYFSKLQQQHDDTDDAERINKILKDLPSLLDGTLEGVERVRDIVMDLLQFSSGQQHEFKFFDLVHTLDTTIRWLTKEHNIQLHCEMPEHLEVEGQPGRIQQVLMNLIQNAIDAVKEQTQPQITIVIKPVNQTVMITISDNGPGIPADILPHIFEPFVTSKSAGKGTGLGLSLSYRFVSDHNGMLKAHNPAGGGAEFILTLPLRHAGESQ